LHGFTCGIDDLLLSQQSNETRRETLVESEECSKRIHMEFTQKTEVDLKDLALEMEVEKVVRSNGESATVKLDRMMSNELNNITSTANKKLLPCGLQKPFRGNCLSYDCNWS